MLVPVNERIECATNTPLSTGLLSAQLDLPMACGGNGLCATCHVHVVSGLENLSPPTDREKRTLSRLTGCRPDSRLSCQCRVLGDVTVKVPEGLYLEALEGLEEYIGKRAGQDILHPGDGRVLVAKGQIITKFIIGKLKEVDFKPWSGMATGEALEKKIL
jgi:ferredoxin